MSVVVPLYNHAGFIAEAITSVLAQGPIVRDVLVIDDGSTDGSAEVMAKLAAQDPRIRFERQPNQGAPATLNAGLDRADGEFLAILNSDDAWLPRRLAKLTAALDDAADAGLVVSNIQCIDAASSAIDNPWLRQAWVAALNGTDQGLALLNANFVLTTSNLLFRQSTWRKIGPLASLRYAHDLDWLLRAVAAGQRVLVLNEALLRYRVHASNTIKEDHGAVRMDWAMSAAAYLCAAWDAARPIDWTHAAAAVQVLRTHELDRAVALCMAYLRREHAPTLAASGMPGDAAFLSVMRSVV